MIKSWIKEHESTIITIAAAIGLWFAVTQSFSRDIDRLDKTIDGLDKRIDKLDSRLTAVGNRVIDMDKRLTSVETILLMQGCHPKAVTAENTKENSSNS